MCIRDSRTLVHDVENAVVVGISRHRLAVTRVDGYHHGALFTRGAHSTVTRKSRWALELGAAGDHARRSLARRIAAAECKDERAPHSPSYRGQDQSRRQ